MSRFPHARRPKNNRTDRKSQIKIGKSNEEDGSEKLGTTSS
jgi:hypothetical protein